MDMLTTSLISILRAVINCGFARTDINDTVGELPKVGGKFHFATAFAILVGKKPHRKPAFMGVIPQKPGSPTVS
jgi:hypothetical protein